MKTEDKVILCVAIVALYAGYKGYRATFPTEQPKAPVVELAPNTQPSALTPWESHASGLSSNLEWLLTSGKSAFKSPMRIGRSVSILRSWMLALREYFTPEEYWGFRATSLRCIHLSDGTIRRL